MSQQPAQPQPGRATAFVPVSIQHTQLAGDPAGQGTGKVRQYPVQLTALSGQVIDHDWWGRIAFDNAGMFRRGDQSPIDWGHDYDTVLGHFTATQQDGSALKITGTLLARTDDPEHRAHEVIDLMSAGQAYQASIDFTARMDGDWEAIYLTEGQTLLANGGQEYSGPLTFFTKWPLNGVAIFTHGYDPYTSAGPAPALLSARLPLGHPMTKSALTPPPDVPAVKISEPPPAIDPKKIEPTADKAAPAEAVPAAAPATLAAPPATPTQLTPTTLKEWSTKFGPANAVDWLTGGKTLAEASDLHAAQLKATSAAQIQEIADLKSKLAALRPGIAAPTGAAIEQDGGDSVPVDNMARLTAANAKAMAPQS